MIGSMKVLTAKLSNRQVEVLYEDGWEEEYFNADGWPEVKN